MAYTYDTTTNRGLVRLLVPDSFGVTDYVFEDAEIDAFLAIEGGVKLATALALETLATNEALVQKVIRLLDLSTDGAKTAATLLKRAALLRTQAEDEDTGLAFDYAEMVVDDFSRQERLVAEALRDA